MAQKLLLMAAVTWSILHSVSSCHTRAKWMAAMLRIFKLKKKIVKNHIDTGTREGKGAIFLEE